VEQLAEHETRQAFDAAITQLPQRYRQIIGLRSLENRPYDEIGPLLGISADAAQKLWRRAIDHLARELE
jgi:RNA polymerase sigma factor (sigma-70 family)